ncbi:MAG: monovalent cation:proton antiporter-2 (CPA2) family protein, partial [Thermodesulfovibrionales bacterium]
MVVSFLTYLVVIFGVSALIVYILNRLKIPSIVGFLIAGVLLGPHGLEIIKDVHTVEVFAEIGVILLMFTIGLEFSLQNLSLLRRSVFSAGTLQVIFTIVVAGGLSFFLLGQSLKSAVFDGFLVSLSSTAIVIKLLMERAEINTPHGRNTVGILIFQDLCVVPFMLLIPILAGQGGGLKDIVFTMLKAVVVIFIVVFLARWGVPHILHEVVKSKSRELFLITIILLCLATALLTQKLGLSLALGAFLAGIVISESEYASQAISDIIPFKESFMGLFFISVGMLLDTSFMVKNITLVLSLVVVILIAKTITASLATSFVCGSIRHSVQTGFYIAQIGEFSFVLAQEGRELALIDENFYQIFLCASVLTMIATPFMIGLAGKSSQWLSSKKMLRRLERLQERHSHNIQDNKAQRHVIIVGFGVNGRNLASALKTSGIPYVILELNPTTVKKMKKLGEPIYFGDSTSLEVLHKVGIMTADMLVVVISDAASTRKTVQIARNERKDIHILVRTRFVAEVD